MSDHSPPPSLKDSLERQIARLQDGRELPYDYREWVTLIERWGTDYSQWPPDALRRTIELSSSFRQEYMRKVHEGLRRAFRATANDSSRRSTSGDSSTSK